MSKQEIFSSYPVTAYLEFIVIVLATWFARWQLVFTEGQGRRAKNKPQFYILVLFTQRNAGK